MALNNITISYNSKLKRVRACFPVEMCYQIKKPDRDIFKRARAKFEKEKNLGNIEEFEIFEDSLLRIWTDIRDGENYHKSRIIEVTIGQGARIIPGIYVFPGSNGDLLEITIKIPAKKLQSITWNCFYYNLHKVLRNNNITQRPHEAMIRSIFKRAQNGEPIKRWPIKPHPSLMDRTVKGLTFTINRQLQEGYAIIFEEQLVNSSKQIEDMLSRCKRAFIAMQKHVKDLIFEEEEIKQQLLSLQTSPESLGIGLPRAILLGYVSRVKDLSQQNQAQAGADAKSGKSTVAEPLEIKYSSDKLTAALGPMENKEIITRMGGEITVEKLEELLSEQGICYGQVEFVDRIIYNLQNNIPVKGMTVARGIEPQKGEQAYLHLCFKENTASREQDFENLLNVNMRKLQNKNTVKAKDLIAEIRFKDAKNGKDVFDREIFHLGTTSDLDVQLGENVYYQDPGRIYAKIDGMPTIEGNAIDCSPMYVHHGDVNLSSGDIEFKGAVTIEGNIDSGALVIAHGDLQVNGRIGPSHIHCKGDITVEGGILTTEKGWVDCLGNIHAEFIENSQISSAGDITAQNSIINSEIICGKTIRVLDKDNGIIAGGFLKAHDIISTGNLGFSRGPKTECSLGGDWRIEKKRVILKHRAAKLDRILDIEGKKARDLSALRRPTQDKIAQLAIINKKIEHAKRILESIHVRLKILDSKFNWNIESRVEIFNEMIDNIEVLMQGRKVEIKSAMKGVIILARAIRGNRIHPIEDLESFQKKEETNEAS